MSSRRILLSFLCVLGLMTFIEVGLVRADKPPATAVLSDAAVPQPPTLQPQAVPFQGAQPQEVQPQTYDDRVTYGSPQEYQSAAVEHTVASPVSAPVNTAQMTRYVGDYTAPYQYTRYYGAGLYRPWLYRPTYSFPYRYQSYSAGYPYAGANPYYTYSFSPYNTGYNYPSYYAGYAGAYGAYMYPSFLGAYWAGSPAYVSAYYGSGYAGYGAFNSYAGCYYW